LYARLKSGRRNAQPDAEPGSHNTARKKTHGDFVTHLLSTNLSRSPHFSAQINNLQAMETPKEWVDFGSKIGRQQAFAVIANRCTASQALSLKQMKESREYEKLGLTWEQFCIEYVGLSRSQVDRIIEQLDELGESFYHLRELAPLSPETFRNLADKVDGETIEIDGVKVPLTPENAPKIRVAVANLRASLRDARNFQRRYAPPVCELRLRLDALVDDSAKLIHLTMPTVDRRNLIEMATRAVDKWTNLLKRIENCGPPTP